MGEWQPIETAPAETWVLVWDSYAGSCVIAANYYGTWVRDGSDYDCPRRPTRWQPLPEPPK